MSMTTSVPLAMFAEGVPSIIPNDDSPRVRESDPLSSHQAADSITTWGRNASQEAVLSFLAGQKLGPVPAWRIERALQDGWSPSRVRTALTELAANGLLRRHSLTGKSARGRKCDEFEAVTS